MSPLQQHYVCKLPVMPNKQQLSVRVVRNIQSAVLNLANQQATSVRHYEINSPRIRYHIAETSTTEYTGDWSISEGTVITSSCCYTSITCCSISRSGGSSCCRIM